jgi:hypothetical protein
LRYVLPYICNALSVDLRDNFFIQVAVLFEVAWISLGIYLPEKFMSFLPQKTPDRGWRADRQ